jgi:DNA invertase Pin-like site-specific DNA recombinase
MLIGYARVSKADGSQSLDLQHDALRAAGVELNNIYEDRASGSRDDRPGLAACLKSLRSDDVLVVWKLDRLGRSLAHLVNTVKDLSDRKIGLRVLTADSDEVGHAFQLEAGHCFRTEAGRGSDLKPAT